MTPRLTFALVLLALCGTGFASVYSTNSIVSLNSQFGHSANDTFFVVAASRRVGTNFIEPAMQNSAAGGAFRINSLTGKGSGFQPGEQMTMTGSGEQWTQVSYAAPHARILNAQITGFFLWDLTGEIYGGGVACSSTDPCYYGKKAYSGTPGTACPNLTDLSGVTECGSVTSDGNTGTCGGIDPGQNWCIYLYRKTSGSADDRNRASAHVAS